MVCQAGGETTFPRVGGKWKGGRRAGWAGLVRQSFGDGGVPDAKMRSLGSAKERRPLLKEDENEWVAMNILRQGA